MTEPLVYICWALRAKIWQKRTSAIPKVISGMYIRRSGGLIKGEQKTLNKENGFS